MGAGSTILYKRYYNKNRGLPEPTLGASVTLKYGTVPDLQCPTCGSTELKYTAHPDDPEEVTTENVRCEHCGRITDWFEAHKQRENHPCDNPRKVVK